ncbi:MAG: energy transducer TonB [Bacteroidia bacterium]|nr:energy transducer TonB [Bacteroidia bacterium]
MGSSKIHLRKLDFFLLILFTGLQTFGQSVDPSVDPDSDIGIEVIEDTIILPHLDQDDPAPNDFITVEKEPVPINLNQIIAEIGYPEEVRKQGIEGKLLFRILVDEKGNYKSHLILKEAHPVLRNAVLSRIKELKFEPAIRNGEPIRFWVTLPFKFALDQTDSK